MVKNIDTAKIWEILKEVPDPEIPVINLVELGVVRGVEYENEKLIITITPTYTGCPAKKLFEDLIVEKLKEKEFDNFEVITKNFPVWTTDFLSDDTKNKLLKEGISPPTEGDKIIVCPHCKSTNTKMISQFGSTPCQSLYACNECKEPFNYFKCHV